MVWMSGGSEFQSWDLMLEYKTQLSANNRTVTEMSSGRPLI